MLKERLYHEHQKLIKKYKSGSENIDKIQNEITQLEETREKEKVRLEKNKLNELERLKARRNECNLKIESLNKKGNESEYVKEYRNKLNNVCEKLQNIDADYTKILNQELDSVKKQHDVNTIYSELKNKQKNKALPGAIEDRLNESLDNVINRNNLNDKSDIISISKKIKPLESLINYAPSWMEIVFKKIFPVAVSAILLIIWLIVGGTSDVAGDAVATVLSFGTRVLLWLFITAIIGVLIGGVLYFACRRFFDEVGFKATFVIGVIIGAFISTSILKSADIYNEIRNALPQEFYTVLDVISKSLLCIGLGVILWLLNNETSFGEKIINLALMLGIGKKQALKHQSFTIENEAESYCIVLRYPEIIMYLVNAEKMKHVDFLKNEIEQLETAYNANDGGVLSKEKSAIQKLNEYEIRRQKIIADSKAEISDMNCRIDKLKTLMATYKDVLLKKLNQELILLNNEYSAIVNKVDEEILKSEQKFNMQIEVDSQKISEEREKLNIVIQEIKNIADMINNNTVGFDESCGVLSDYLYLLRKSQNDIFEYSEIKHDKEPIVFLYDIKDSTNVSAALYNFMYVVLEGIYTINSRDSFEVIINDPVTKGRKFEQLASMGLLTIENDIHKLSNSIQTSMQNVAQTGKHIDVHNREMHANGEDKIKYLKYKIVEFIVPEENISQSMNFFDSDLWGTLGDHENGFIPIFYISYSDWVNTFDENSKINSRFIKTLKAAIGTGNNHVYKIDAEKISIEKVI